MNRYLRAFNFFSDATIKQAFETYSWESLFLLYQWSLSKISSNDLTFIIVTFLIYVFLLLKAIKKIFLPWQYIYIFFAFLCYPFFYNYILNGMRQGLAMMLILLAMTYWIKKRNSFKFYISIIFSGLIHVTSFFFTIPLFIVLWLNIKLKYLLLLWTFAIFLFLTDLNSFIANIGIINELNFIELYTNNGIIEVFGETNKINFLVFSSFFLLLSLFLYKYIDLDEKLKNIYLVTIKTYTVFNILFLLFGFIAYSNRLAAYSWHLLPLLILFPILHKSKHSPFLLIITIVIFMIIGWVTSPLLIYR